jgi:hypothetical protein
LNARAWLARSRGIRSRSGIVCTSGHPGSRCSEYQQTIATSSEPQLKQKQAAMDQVIPQIGARDHVIADSSAEIPEFNPASCLPSESEQTQVDKSPRELLLEHCIHLLSMESATWKTLYYQKVNGELDSQAPPATAPSHTKSDQLGTTDDNSDSVEGEKVEVDALRAANKCLAQKNVTLREQVEAAWQLNKGNQSATVTTPKATHDEDSIVELASSATAPVSLELLTTKVRALENELRLRPQSRPESESGSTAPHAGHGADAREQSSSHTRNPCDKCACCETHTRENRSAMLRLTQVTKHGQSLLGAILASNTAAALQPGQCIAEVRGWVDLLENTSRGLHDKSSLGKYEENKSAHDPAGGKSKIADNNRRRSTTRPLTARRASTTDRARRGSTTNTLRRPSTASVAAAGTTTGYDHKAEGAVSRAVSGRDRRRSSSSSIYRETKQGNHHLNHLSELEKKEAQRPLPRGLYSWTTSASSTQAQARLSFSSGRKSRANHNAAAPV